MAGENLSPALITANLGTRFIGRRVLYYPQVTSTMDIARQVAQRGASQGTVVVADEQTAGRGRVKRIWLSPKGSIALSIILHPLIHYLPYLSMLASLAVVHSLKTVIGQQAQIKWPNDVLINGKKVCGILIENDVQKEVVNYAIIGIGLNANFRAADFSEIAAIATSLSDAAGREVSRLEIIRSLLVEIENLYLTLPTGETIYQEWRSRLVTLGRKVQVKSGITTLVGIAESVFEDGSLQLRQADGSTMRIVAGDVTLRDHQE